MIPNLKSTHSRIKTISHLILYYIHKKNMLQLQSQNSHTGEIHSHYLHLIHMAVYDNWNNGLYKNHHITAHYCQWFYYSNTL